MKPDQFRVNYENERDHWWFVARRRILLRIGRRILEPGASVVDVGCGTGANIAAFGHRYRALGIDPSADAIGFARALFPECEFVQGFAPHDLPAWAQTPDLFVLTDVLEHVERDRELLHSLWDGAGAGTQFLLTVPADPRLWTRHDESHGHYRRYRPEEFAALWGEKEAEVRLFSAYNTRLYPVVRGIREVNRRTGRTSGAADTDVRTPPAPVNAFLTSLFAGEGASLEAAIDHGSRTLHPYRRGVSLIALLRKQRH